MGDDISELEIVQNKELVLGTGTENVHDLNHPIGQQIVISTHAEKEKFSESMKVIEEMMQFLEKSERDLDKLAEQIYSDEGDAKTEFSIEEGESQDSASSISAEI